MLNLLHRFDELLSLQSSLSLVFIRGVHLKFTFGFGTHRHVVIDELAPGRQVDGDGVIVKAHILVGEGRHESSCWQFGATG